MRLDIPNSSMVLLVGGSGAGKSTFAARHFAPTEILSSDGCRGLVSNDPNDLGATGDAFDLLQFLLRKRLRRKLLTVIDATNVRREDRATLIRIAKDHHCLTVAIVFDLPEALHHERNAARPDRQFGPHVVRGHRRQLRRSLGAKGRGGGKGGLKKEGIHRTWIFQSVEEVDSAEIQRQPLWNDRRHESGPFDVIGDVHGCLDELIELLVKLGWRVDGEALRAEHPEGRKLVFLGDLVDRGPRNPEALRFVMHLVEDGVALCVPGNHDAKLLRHLNGRKVKLNFGLDKTVEQLDALPDREAFLDQARAFLDGLVSHYLLDGGRLVVVHAGLPESLQGGASGAVRSFALYGETTGETDEFGLPVRWNWASEYKGEATVLYGHTPVTEAEWQNGTLCLDTGCVFGGKLSALRWPEREIVEVQAKKIYAVPGRPIDQTSPDSDAAGAAACSAAKDVAAPETKARADRESRPAMLDLGDVIGKQVLKTRLIQRITLREEQTAAALEVLGRFAVESRWLIYLPPTMAAPATMPEGEFLEHPGPALDEFAREGVNQVICQEKHMGSRAIVIVTRNGEAARRRFQARGEELGIVYTRTGRRFFKDPELEGLFLEKMRASCEQSGLFERLETDWLCLDGEILPWSAKAQSLLVEQYAPIGAAAEANLSRGYERLAQTHKRLDLLRQNASGRQGPGEDFDESVADLEARLALNLQRRRAVEGYREAYGRYCWPTENLDGIEFAPFHVLAGEAGAFFEKDHLWHLGEIDRLVEAAPSFMRRTGRRVVDLDDPESRQRAVDWWLEMTTAGGEGMVIKPMEFIAKGRRGLAQPGIKCRGREYLRIIYGPEYTLPEHLDRLRSRGLGRKRSLARREFALGVEALERFVAKAALHRVHPLVFGVLALESEPVDPRL